MKEHHLNVCMKPFCWTCISQWLKFHFLKFLLPKHKVLIYSVSVYYCLPLCKVWWSKANDPQKVTSSNLELFLSKAQKQLSTWKLRLFSYQMFHNVSRSSWSTDCEEENSKPQLGKLWGFRASVGTDQAKFEKILISRVILLGYLRFLVSNIRCEAKKSKPLREERPID